MKLLVRMTPKGFYHTGGQHTLFPFPRSDTFFSAIASGWSLLWGKEDWDTVFKYYLNAKEKEPVPFTVSSIFPKFRELYLLPRSSVVKIEDELESNAPIHWVSASIYKNLQPSYTLKQGTVIDPDIYCPAEDADNVNEFSGRPFWEYSRQHMRNKMDVLQNTATAYPANAVYYHEELELYAFIELQQEFKDKLEGVLRLLADEGIGGKRSSGGGAFWVHPLEELPPALDFFNEPAKKDSINLALYYPCLEDVEKGILKNARYKLVERQGWQLLPDGTSIAKKKIRLLKEGSYLPADIALTPRYLIDVSAGDCPGYHYVYPFIMAIPGGVTE